MSNLIYQKIETLGILRLKILKTYNNNTYSLLFLYRFNCLISLVNLTGISFLIFGLVSFALFWLHADSLVIRFEIKTFLRSLGFGVLGLAFTLNFLSPLLEFGFPQIAIWLTSISFYLIFLSFILDPHSKLQAGLVIGIIALFFLQNHSLLSLQSALISISVLQLAYTIKHRDLIPFGLGFILITIGEFFQSLGEEFAASGAILYIFASISLFFWIWQYLVIRFNLSRKLKL